MTLGERFKAILGDLPPGWEETDFVVAVPDPGQVERAALILASLAPGRSGASFRVRVVASGFGGPSPDAVRRVLDRLEGEGVDARLAEPEARAVRLAAPAEEAHRSPLADSWDAILATLPADWSDAYLEVELASSDDIERAALLLGPANPFLIEDDRPVFRFRSANRFGYGVAPAMTHRVLTRLDDDGIAGTLQLLRLHSDMHPVLTQGPVWRESGRAV